MLTVTVGKGRKRRVLEFPNLNRQQAMCMTERTQLQMFGEVVMRKPETSIHPFGRKRMPAKQWEAYKQATKGGE